MKIRHLAVVSLLALAACSKPDPVPVPAADPVPAAPAVVAPAPAPAPAPVAAPPAPAAKVAVQAKRPAKAKKPAVRLDADGIWPADEAAVKALSDEEFAAYAKAVTNGLRAECLLNTVELKMSGDVALGRIRDFGNVLEAQICQFEVAAR